MADLSREGNPALTELELEAQERTQRLLERANALRMEQEDEVKQLNKVKSVYVEVKQPVSETYTNVSCRVCVFMWCVQLMLSAQCQATRDTQIQEKKQIRTELLEEEKRLDAMMEVERLKALETVEQIDELRREQRIR